VDALVHASCKHGGRRVWSACRLLRDGGDLLEHGVAAAMSGAAKNLIKKKYFYHMASVLVDPRQKRNLMAPVHLEPRHKRDSMASCNNRGQKGYLLASPQYASVSDPRQNEKNNRGKKPLLHWCRTKLACHTP